MYYLKRIQDAGVYTNTVDVPYRFVPCMVSGLSYYLAQKYKPEAVQNLKLLYEDEFQRAFDRGWIFIKHIFNTTELLSKCLSLPKENTQKQYQIAVVLRFHITKWFLNGMVLLCTRQSLRQRHHKCNQDHIH